MPGPISDEISVVYLLVSMLRVRNDQTFMGNKVFMRMMKRLIHIVGQAAELAMEKHITSDCPQPSIESKYHPFLQGSRRRGNTALSQSLVARFHARGGGYVSAKEELNLAQLGISDKRSFGSRTASEYCARVLLKTANVHERLCFQKDFYGPEPMF